MSRAERRFRCAMARDVKQLPIFGWGAERLCQSVLSILLALSTVGCESTPRQRSTDRAQRTEGAVNLGNLRFGRAPSAGEVRLADFLFGSVPASGVTPIKPTDIASLPGGALMISDMGHATVLHFDGRALAGLPIAGVGVSWSPADDTLLVTDPGGSVVSRYNSNGDVLQRYTLSSSGFRPVAAAIVGDAVWVTNSAAHRIEVFDSASGAHRRSIGRRGSGVGEFRMPAGITFDAEEVFVVDTLGRRVHVFDTDGSWRREIGTLSATRIGLGRPKDVAVGPDGRVFVTDATGPAVRVYERDGRYLTSFGFDPDDSATLALPSGVAIVSNLRAATERAGPARIAYHVLVCEQVNDPGVRAFAWLGRPSKPVRPTTSGRLARVTPTVANPHWEPTGCAACHTESPPRAIARDRADAICLSCHDNQKAVAEVHPIGRAATSAMTRPADGFPLVDGKLGCLTCHDVARHCDPTARPSASNPALVRAFDRAAPLEFCRQCHIADNWRFNPHQPKIDGQTSQRTCLFCHEVSNGTAGDSASKRVSRETALRVDGTRLHAEPTRLCLGCHTVHADLAPNGHLGQRIDASDRYRPPVDASLPLHSDRITCATCHNPHRFNDRDPAPFRIGTLAPSVADRAILLRQSYDRLCTNCHPQ